MNTMRDDINVAMQAHMINRARLVFPPLTTRQNYKTIKVFNITNAMQ